MPYVYFTETTRESTTAIIVLDKHYIVYYNTERGTLCH